MPTAQIRFRSTAGNGITSNRSSVIVVFVTLLQVGTGASTLKLIVLTTLYRLVEPAT